VNCIVMMEWMYGQNVFLFVTECTDGFDVIVC
jgi:hypothetical protein